MVTSWPIAYTLPLPIGNDRRRRLPEYQVPPAVLFPRLHRVQISVGQTLYANVAVGVPHLAPQREMTVPNAAKELPPVRRRVDVGPCLGRFGHHPQGQPRVPAYWGPKGDEGLHLHLPADGLPHHSPSVGVGHDHGLGRVAGVNDEVPEVFPSDNPGLVFPENPIYFPTPPPPVHGRPLRTPTLGLVPPVATPVKPRLLVATAMGPGYGYQRHQEYRPLQQSAPTNRLSNVHSCHTTTKMSHFKTLVNPCPVAIL